MVKNHFSIKPKIILDNNVSILVTKEDEDTILIFEHLGVETDIKIGINGISHFFEHFVFKNDYKLTKNLNAATYPTFMCFYGYNSNGIENIIEMFYKKIQDGETFKYVERINQDDYFDDIDDLIESVSRELENEYYFRSMNSAGCFPLSILFKQVIYMGGKKSDFKNIDTIKKVIKDIWNSISGDDISFIIPPKKSHEIIELIERTFGTKKKTVTITSTKNIRSYLPQKPKEPSYVYMSSINSPYGLTFRFRLSELPNIKRALTVLTYFLNFRSLGTISVIGDHCYLTFEFIDESSFKFFLYGLKTFKFSDLNIKDIEIFFGFRDIGDKSLYHKCRTMIDHYDINTLGNSTPIELISEATSFLRKIQDKIFKYGEFYIQTPMNNVIQTDFDSYGHPYILMACSLQSYFDHLNIISYSTDNPFFYREGNGLNKLQMSKLCMCNYVCKYNGTGNRQKDKYKVSRKYLPSIIRNGIKLEYQEDDEFIVSSSYSKINKLGYDILINPREYLNTISLPKLNSLFRAYLHGYNLPRFSDMIYMVHNDYRPINDSFYKMSLDFSRDQYVTVMTHLLFVCFYMKIPHNSDFDIHLLKHRLKSEGTIYTAYTSEYSKDRYNYYHFFSPTVFPDRLCHFTKDYVKSFDDESIIITIKSIKGDKYDVDALDKHLLYFDTLKL